MMKEKNESVALVKGVAKHVERLTYEKLGNDPLLT